MLPLKNHNRVTALERSVIEYCRLNLVQMNPNIHLLRLFETFGPLLIDIHTLKQELSGTRAFQDTSSEE